ncbi:hypothetical protein NKG94_27130 [Micromonospora sp. M12]
MEALDLALTGAQEVLGGGPGTRYVLVQHGRGAAGLAKTLRLEAPQARITIVHLPDDASVVDRVVTEVAGTVDYREVRYDASGVRRCRRCAPCRCVPPGPPGARRGRRAAGHRRR